MGNLGIGDAGLVINFFNTAGQLRAKLNALATDNRARILSTPSIVARNGEPASVQVGDEVPIVTSNQTTGSSVSGQPGQVTPSTLQTIQYRNTGVILKVRPTIFSDDRVDLDVVQEVSAARQTSTGVNISPTFSQRKVETKLTLREGSTVMLAGLISSQDTRTETGVPLLKDIPVVGAALQERPADDRAHGTRGADHALCDLRRLRRPGGDRRVPQPSGWLERRRCAAARLARLRAALDSGPALPSAPAPEGRPGASGLPTPAVPKPASEAPILDGVGASQAIRLRGRRRPVPSHRH